MYLHSELKVVPITRQTEAIARLNFLHSLMARTPGFIDAQICQFLGSPSGYWVQRAFENAAAHAAYRASDDAKEFTKVRPVGLYENLLVQEWECENDGGPAGGGFLVRETLQVGAGGWGAYGPVLKGLKPAGGTLRGWRNIDKAPKDAGNALLLTRWPDRAAYNAYLESQQYPADRDRTATVAAPLVVECYAVVDEVKPA